MKCFFGTLLILLFTFPLYSNTDSTVFDTRSYADEVDLKYSVATDIKSSYLKKNLFKNSEDEYSMLIDAYFDGDYVVIVDSYEDDNSNIRDDEFYFSEGKLVFALIKQKIKDEEEFISKKCYYFEQMMVLMIDERGKEHGSESLEFKKISDLVSWRVTEIMDLLNK